MNEKIYPPCDPGCYSHVSHPCEKCGRLQGKEVNKMNEKIREAYLKREEEYDFPYPDDGIDKIEMLDIAETFYMDGVRDLLSSPEIQGLVEALAFAVALYGDGSRVNMKPAIDKAKKALSHFEHTTKDCPACSGRGHLLEAVGPPYLETKVPCPNCQDGKIRRWIEK